MVLARPGLGRGRCFFFFFFEAEQGTTSVWGTTSAYREAPSFRESGDFEIYSDRARRKDINVKTNYRWH